MFFDSLDDIERIARCNGVSVFVVPKDMDYSLKQAIVLQPEEKSVITIDQVRKIMALLSVKQTEDRFILIRPADKMNDESANAILKNLEEPGEKIHYVLMTDAISELLPTVLSRSAVYFLRNNNAVESGIRVDEKIKAIAKRMIVAKPADLPALADEIAKKKDGVREYSLQVLGAAIEMLYKTYLINGKMIFLKKIPKFLDAYDNISKNGHIKLHLVADLC